MTHKLIAGLLIILIALPAAAPPLAAQGSCEASVLSDLHRETHKFGEDVDKEGMEFVKSDMGESVLAAARDLTKRNVTAQEALNFHSKYQEWLKFKEHVQIGVKVANDLEDCRAGGFRVQCLLDVARNQNEAIKDWLNSLVREDFQTITARVTKAGAIVRNYAERAFGTAQNSIDSYVSNCNANFDQRAQANSAGNNTTNAVRGGGGAKAGLLIATLAATGGGLWYVKKTLDENQAFLDEFGDITTPRSSPVSNTPTTPAPPTGVRAYDGTYDFWITITRPGGEDEHAFPRYLIINNGSLTTAQRDINGSISSTGTLVNVVGVCPINSGQADFTGSIANNGIGSGRYRCRIGGIERGWRVANRR